MVLKLKQKAMLLGIIKRYNTSKCTRIAVKLIGFWGDAYYYEARVFTTQAGKTVPEGDELGKVAKQIVEANWAQEDWRDYTHRAKLKDYPHLTIVIKIINKPTEEDFQKDDGTTNE